MKDFWSFILLVVCAVALLAMFSLFSYAAPPEGADLTSPIAKWYRSLQNPVTKMSCCDWSDCRPTKARVIDGHYEVWHEDQWLPVPDHAILPQMENPVGEPVACVYFGTVLCLVRGAEG